jgi:hypothetical protein
MASRPPEAASFGSAGIIIANFNFSGSQSTGNCARICWQHSELSRRAIMPSRPVTASHAARGVKDLISLRTQTEGLSAQAFDSNRNYRGLLGVKLRNTQHEQKSSTLPPRSDVAVVLEGYQGEAVEVISRQFTMPPASAFSNCPCGWRSLRYNFLYFQCLPFDRFYSCGRATRCYSRFCYQRS